MECLLNTIYNLSLEKIIYQLLGFICHQDKSILIVVGENSIPLCPRCLGLHIGFFLSLIFINRIIQRKVNLDKPCNLFVITFLISLAGIHWILGTLDILEMNSLSRFITGFVSGSGLYILLYSINRKSKKSEFLFSACYKILIPFLLMALLYAVSFNSYKFFLPALLILVAFNIMSIIIALWSIVEQNNVRRNLIHLNREVKS